MKKNSLSLSNYITDSVWLIILVGVDRLTKYFFYDLEWFKENYFIEPVMNMGISFSIHVPYSIVISLSVCAIFVFGYLYYNKIFSRTVSILLMAGALGNFYDRVVYDGVKDFLVMPGFFIFNIADLFLSTAMIIVFIGIFYHRKD